MTIKTIIIDGNSYKYYNPDSYIDYKLLLKQIKRVEQKIKASQPGGCYHGKILKCGKSHYSAYPILLEHLLSLLDN